MLRVYKDGYIHLFLSTIIKKIDEHRYGLIVIADEMGEVIEKKRYMVKDHPPAEMIGVVGIIKKIVPQQKKHIYVIDPVTELWSKQSNLVKESGCIVECVDQSINLAWFHIEDNYIKR